MSRLLAQPCFPLASLHVRPLSLRRRSIAPFSSASGKMDAARFLGLWLMTLLLGAPCLCAQAKEETFPENWKSTENKIVFAGDKAHYPFHFLDPNGRPAGFDVEMIRSISERKGWNTHYRLETWASIRDLLEAGRVDIVPMFLSTERSGKYLFSNPIIIRPHLVFGRRGGKYVATLDDLSGQLVAVQYGAVAWEELRSKSSSISLLPFPTEGEAVLAVERGVADYALVPGLTGHHVINKKRLKNVVTLSPPLMERAYAYAISRKRPELVAQVNSGLRLLQVNGKQDELYFKWLANIVPPAESYWSGLLAGAWIALPLLLSTVLVYMWWRHAHRQSLHHYQRAEVEAKLRQDAQEQVRYLAFRDTVTGLPNRNSLENSLQSILKEAAQQGRRCALVRLDLVGLDLIQTVAGQELSNKVIQEVGRRLVSRWGEEVLAHLGRGEFALVLKSNHGGQEFDDALRALMSLVQDRIQFDELSLAVECRIGMAQFPEHGSTVHALLRAAEMACSNARQRQAPVCVYDPRLEPDPRNLTLLADLRQALCEGTLGYALQPKLSFISRRFVGAEMLVRWDHPKYGSLPPEMFVPLAEQTGVVSDMTLYLARRALGHCREWQRQGLDMSLSVNVSVNDLANPALVDAIVQETDGVGHMLMLEITETGVMRDPDKVMQSIGHLRKRGIRISLDDFGTGHASLTYLQRMAPDELKIDRSFVSNLLSTPNDQLIVQTSIQLAHDLGAKVTAEGIEDAKTMEWFASAGCDLAQGFGIAKPMSITELMRHDLLCHR